ncbi:LOW QUALITY PROTEIN: hormonally up-regulated neu tumor-associated kinase homolog A-like [Gigantopelta aegis]|uniref:LOW QUALITY PROTEIN: hormonally up-regulated neu tumor-associated kinase homolog A-like n=1 Tax=Gigantopelta aegis TaxID=1735272 RepID=UPI001B88C8ED|nr:LOW QUALITY PROTEIN: hormonally up-regulated neu tumor-associated kinase homolog A-like [Gigantopelta aegis]
MLITAPPHLARPLLRKALGLDYGKRKRKEPKRLSKTANILIKEDSKGYVHSKKVNNYLIGATLGEGSFAKVKESFHVLVGEKVAMKIIDKKKALQDPYVAKNFKREARLLQKLRHPNIMQLYEVIETDNNYYLITELCSGGELMKYIYKHGRLSEEESRKYMRQLVSAVDHLHRAGLIHRDLKVENMLLDGNMDLKLIVNFGLSNEEFVVDESGIEKHSSRLARYRREFPSKTSRQLKTITTPKKKVSKDLGFYDADDDVEVSSVASVPVRTTTREELENL